MPALPELVCQEPQGDPFLQVKAREVSLGRALWRPSRHGVHGDVMALYLPLPDPLGTWQTGCQELVRLRAAPAPSPQRSSC